MTDEQPTLDHDFVPPPPIDRHTCHHTREYKDGRLVVCGKSLREHVDPRTTTFPLEPKDGP